MKRVIRWLILAAMIVGALPAVEVPVADAATVVVSQTTLPRLSNGRIDRAYPDGNDSAPLVWGTCPNLTLAVGDDTDFNLRTLCALTGTNALTATLAKASGTLPTGCTPSTDGIDCTDAAELATSTLVWQATDGTSSVTVPFTITVNAVAVSDTTAPTVPTGCAYTSGPGTVTVTCDQASDPWVSGAGSGVRYYRVYKDGVLVATATAPSANVQSDLAALTVGGADGTQSCAQTGADRLLSSGGTGLGSTTDQFFGCGYAITGDFIATAKVNSFSGAVTTGTAGWMLRASDAAGSIYGTARARDSDDKANNRFRSSTNGSASNGELSAAQTYPYWLKLLYSGGSVQPLLSSNGLTFTAIEAARPLSLGTSPYLLAFLASGDAGDTVTNNLQQINIAPVATWSTVVSTSTGGSFTVKTEDFAGNLSAATTAVTAAPEAASCTGTTNITTLHADDFEYGSNGEPVDRTPATNGNDGSYVNNAARWTTSDDINATYDEPPLISTVHARNGTRSMRTSITYHNGTVFHTMPNGQVPHRNEVSTKNSTADGFPNPTDVRAIGGHYWFAFSLWLPGDADTDAQTNETDAFGDPKMPAANYPPGQKIFWQLKNAADACDNVQSNPTLQFDYGYLGADQAQPREHLRINLQHARSNHTQNCQGDPAAASFPAGFNSSTYSGNTAPFSHAVTTLYTEDWRTDRGQWVDWIIHWVPDYDNDGILQIWKVKAGTTTEVVRRQGPTMQRDARVNGAIKIGQYMGGANGWGIAASPTVYPSKTVVYHDDLIQAVANGASGFAETSDCAFREVSPAND